MSNKEPKISIHQQQNAENPEERLLGELQANETLLQKQIATERRIAKNLRTRIDQIEKSATYRLAKLITKNAHSPFGWIKMPFSFARVGLKYFRSNYKSRSNPAGLQIIPAPKPLQIIFEAAKISKRSSIEKAIIFIEHYGKPEDQVVTNLFKANLSIARDDAWAMYLNAYLVQFDIAPIQLKPGVDKRFYRIFADPGYTIDQGPKVSIIMPVFNAEKTLSTAVDSILKQTWQNIELIIIDDASTDDSWNTIKALAAADSRIKILRNTVNVGPYVSKNHALHYVTGSYITGHDADDWAHPQRIERHLAAMLAEPKVKVSVAYMLRMNEEAELCHFLNIGPNSFDGAAHLALISAIFETDTFKRRFGHWDSVRFAADSELIERASASLGLGFQTVELITMFCLNINSSLTNHPVHGIRINGSQLSETRRRYREHWRQWHKTLPRESAFLDFPPTQRKFDTPKEMIVDLACIKMLGDDIMQ